MKKTYKARDEPKKAYRGRNNKTEKGENTMAHRSTVNPKTDKQVFTNTAKKTKKINISPKPSRGGIRL